MTGKTTKKPKGPVPAAFGVLYRVFSGGFADILLDAELKRLPPESRPLTTEIVYGVLRHCIRIDWIIDSCSRIRTKKMETKVLSALRIGVYQLLFLSRVPAFAALNETTELVKPGNAKKAGFVNAVLRKVDSMPRSFGSFGFPNPERDPLKYAAVFYSHPEWMVTRWAERYGMEGAVKLCKANLRVPPKTIRVNTLVTSRATLARELADAGAVVTETAYSPTALEVSGHVRLRTGDPRYYIQDEASQLVAYLLGPAPDETVLDACAAPGGKTSHIAALMKNTGVLYALDKSPGRARVLKRTLKEQKASIAMVINADAGAPLCFKGPGARGSAGLFDAILVDAPCSGLGVLGRSPDIKLRRTEADLAELSKRQARLLDNLSGYLKKGGRMVYSVCSLEPEETLAVIEGFLRSHKDFELEDASESLPRSCAPLVDDDGFLRTLPQLHHTDGFFAARLRRTG